MLRKPAYGRIFFEADNGDAGGNTSGTDAATTTSTTATPPSTGESDAVTFSDAQQKEINRLIGKARQEGRDAEKQVNATAEQERQAEAARQAEIEKGNFEKVKTDLETERDGFKTERDQLTAKVDRYEALTKTRVDAIKGELPAEAVEDFPADADAIDQLEWLEGRKALLAKLAPAAAQGNGHPRVPATPPAQGNVKQEATSLVSRHAI